MTTEGLELPGVRSERRHCRAWLSKANVAVHSVKLFTSFVTVFPQSFKLLTILSSATGLMLRYWLTHPADSV